MILVFLYILCDVPWKVPQTHSVFLTKLDAGSDGVNSKPLCTTQACWDSRSAEMTVPEKLPGVWRGLPFAAMGMNSIGAYMSSRLCYTWVPLAFPSFFGERQFTESQLFWSSIAVTSSFLLAFWYLYRKRLFWHI